VNQADAINALWGYTLAHGDPAFIHQHAVDAFTAQTATAQSKPVAVAFALIGLHLYIEKGFSGRQVQRAHMALAKRKRVWPSFPLPADRGAITAIEVIAIPPGLPRDQAIRAWSECVWRSYGSCHPAVATLLADHGFS
jgi:hypothetical protein